VLIFLTENTVQIHEAILWADIAKDDLKVSKFLYDNGQYRYSIYTLQQAIEKSIKSYDFFLQLNGTVTEKTLRTMSHHGAHQYLNDMVTKGENGNRDDMPKHIDNFFSQLEKMSKKRHPTDITNDEYETVIEMLMLLPKTQSQKNKIISYTCEVRLMANRLLKNFQMLADIKYHDCPDIINNVNDPNFVSEFTEAFVNMNTRITHLIHMSAITQSHVESTRYYDFVMETSPLEFYTVDNLIVKDYPILFDSANSSINALVRFFYIIARPNVLVLYNH
jgi:hypothetical protein